MIGRSCVASTLLLLGMLSMLAAAPTTKSRGSSNGALQTNHFKIETDGNWDGNLISGTFSMPHHVHFSRPGTDATGDSASGNYKDGLVTIVGHVVVHDNGEAPEAREAGAMSNAGPSTLTCDQLQIDSKQKIYVATGNVRFVQGVRVMTAQNGRLDQTNHQLDLSGNVHLAEGASTFASETVHYNTLTKDVSTTGNPITITEPLQSSRDTKSSLPTPRPAPKKK
jgi:Lipopolysaccharide-assembly, LptC-related